GVALPDGGEDLEAVRLRQVVVADDRVDLLPVEEALAVVEIVDHEKLDVHAAATETLADELDVGGIVLDLEDAEAFGGNRRKGFRRGLGGLRSLLVRRNTHARHRTW